MTTVYKCKFCNQAFTKEVMVFTHVQLRHHNDICEPIFVDEQPDNLRELRSKVLREN